MSTKPFDTRENCARVITGCHTRVRCGELGRCKYGPLPENAAANLRREQGMGSSPIVHTEPLPFRPGSVGQFSHPEWDALVPPKAGLVRRQGGVAPRPWSAWANEDRHLGMYDVRDANGAVVAKDLLKQDAEFIVSAVNAQPIIEEE